MASNGTAQGYLSGVRNGVGDSTRNRSMEQYNSSSGNPMLPMFNTGYTPGYGYGDMYNQNFYGSGIPSGGQRSDLGRYAPPMLGPGNQWSNQGGYSYNLPNNFGPYLGGYGSGNPMMVQSQFMNDPSSMQNYMNQTGGGQGWRGNHGMHGGGMGRGMPGALPNFARGQGPGAGGGFGPMYGGNMASGYAKQYPTGMTAAGPYMTGGSGTMGPQDSGGAPGGYSRPTTPVMQANGPAMSGGSSANTLPLFLRMGY